MLREYVLITLAVNQRGMPYLFVWWLLQMKRKISMAYWNMDSFKTGICEQPPLLQPYSLLSVSNNCCIRSTLRYFSDYLRIAILNSFIRSTTLSLSGRCTLTIHNSSMSKRTCTTSESICKTTGYFPRLPKVYKTWSRNMRTVSKRSSSALFRYDSPKGSTCLQWKLPP